jgi:enhancing lycopene biosynthesis protein 2
MSGGKTIGVILSGCGFLDGAEIHESVLTLLALDEAGVNVRVFAPDIELDEVDHRTGKATGNKRQLLSEAARISRGKIEDVASVKGTDVDGWVLPGGYGAAKNLCDFAEKGPGATAHKEVARVVREALAAQLPVGACCIAPALLAVITKSSGPQLKLTIGNDEGTAKALRSLGAQHVDAPVTDVVIDADHRVVTAPAYMYGDAPLRDVNAGIKKMVHQVVAWA